MLNKMTIIGFVGKKPETRFTKDNMQVTKFSVATDHKYKGESVTTWHNCVSFGKTAEFVDTYVEKGAVLYVEGRLEKGSFEGKDGKVYTTDIMVEQVKSIRKPSVKPQDEKPAYEKPAEDDELDDSIPF